MITTATSGLGVLCCYCLQCNDSVERSLSLHGSRQSTSAKQGRMSFKYALKNNEGVLLAMPDILVFDKGSRPLKLFRLKGHLVCLNVRSPG